MGVTIVPLSTAALSIKKLTAIYKKITIIYI